MNAIRMRAGPWGRRVSEASGQQAQQVGSSSRNECVIDIKLIFQTVNKLQRVAIRDVAYGWQQQQQHMLNKL